MKTLWLAYRAEGEIISSRSFATAFALRICEPSHADLAFYDLPVTQPSLGRSGFEIEGLPSNGSTRVISQVLERREATPRAMIGGLSSACARLSLFRTD